MRTVSEKKVDPLEPSAAGQVPGFDEEVRQLGLTYSRLRQERLTQKLERESARRAMFAGSSANSVRETALTTVSFCAQSLLAIGCIGLLVRTLKTQTGRRSTQGCNPQSGSSQTDDCLQEPANPQKSSLRLSRTPVDNRRWGNQLPQGVIACKNGSSCTWIVNERGDSQLINVHDTRNLPWA